MIYIRSPESEAMSAELIDISEPAAQKATQPAPPSKTMLSYFTKLPAKPLEVKEANPRKLAPALNRKHVEKFQNTRLEQFDAELFSLNNNDCNVIAGMNGCKIQVEDERDEIICIQVNDIKDQKHIPFRVFRKQRGALRARLLQYHEDVRPPYWGTWQRKSKIISGRRPFAQDEDVFDYEADSEAEWDLGGPGESLKGDDSEDEEELDDYEIDMKTFVPHGYVSDDEADGCSDQDEEAAPSSANLSISQEICDQNVDDSSSIQIVGEIGLKPVNELKQHSQQSKPQAAPPSKSPQLPPPAPKSATKQQDLKPISLGIYYEDREPVILSESKIQFLKAFQGCPC